MISNKKKIHLEIKLHDGSMLDMFVSPNLTIDKLLELVTCNL